MSLVRAPNLYAAPVVRRSLAEDLFDGFERLFDDVSRGDVQSLAMDFFENEEALVIELAVPGVTSSGIDVSVEGRQLTVRVVPAFVARRRQGTQRGGRARCPNA